MSDTIARMNFHSPLRSEAVYNVAALENHPAGCRSDDQWRALRSCQQQWAVQPLSHRLAWSSRLAGLIATRVDSLVDSLVRPAVLRKGELLSSEVLPLAEACRYVARRGKSVLSPQTLSRRDGAWWMGKIVVRQQRLPWGVVLIIGPSNYPLLLPGVQMIQSVAAGNAVLVKPAPGCAAVMDSLVELCIQAGAPRDLIQVLDPAPQSAQSAMQAGVDKVMFTGSLATGQAVARQLVDTMTPATLELSGNDAVVVCDSADVQRAAKAIAYALDMNGGQTCISPRRLFATRSTLNRLLPLLTAELTKCRARAIAVRSAEAAARAIDEAVAAGACFTFGSASHLVDARAVRPVVLDRVTAHMPVTQLDLFAPLLSVIEVAHMDDAIEQTNRCQYALGASVFGRQDEALALADRIQAGCITINDLIVPTADPRVSFGGWRKSGYGVTRGLEGLRDATQLHVTCERRGRWMPHLTTSDEQLPGVLRGLLLLRHGPTLKDRWAGIQTLIRSGKKARQ